ncbi:hypothetical protein HGH92_26605 [Chitinophaga varians]|uniref:Uncharacterized protein n=1 Tax=Chitinophaga varians TaxID=2202339 RepID=A0A847S0P0_9BACT|nr:hypothetical protein [Chitinophaga varians]NLR67904.1 hypothetical protein [Chitinophaga varians]
MKKVIDMVESNVVDIMGIEMTLDVSNECLRSPFYPHKKMYFKDMLWLPGSDSPCFFFNALSHTIHEEGFSKWPPPGHVEVIELPKNINDLFDKGYETNSPELFIGRILPKVKSVFGPEYILDSVQLRFIGERNIIPIKVPDSFVRGKSQGHFRPSDRFTVEEPVSMDTKTLSFLDPAGVLILMNGYNTYYSQMKGLIEREKNTRLVRKKQRGGSEELAKYREEVLERKHDFIKRISR